MFTNVAVGWVFATVHTTPNVLFCFADVNADDSKMVNFEELHLDSLGDNQFRAKRKLYGV